MPYQLFGNEYHIAVNSTQVLLNSSGLALALLPVDIPLELPGVCIPKTAPRSRDADVLSCGTMSPSATRGAVNRFSRGVVLALSEALPWNPASNYIRPRRARMCSATRSMVDAVCLEVQCIVESKVRVSCLTIIIGGLSCRISLEFFHIVFTHSRRGRGLRFSHLQHTSNV